LGGRPPYGYRIADAGPHPNRADAAWGRRLHRLEPDPQTAPWVKWIFARRLEGHSIAGIARMLNEMQILCPSAFDRARNPHRPAQAWRQRTVAAIVANPRYTGRQVWNRQQTKRRPTEDVIPGVAGVRRLAPSQGWAISDKPAHEPLVSESDFVAAQNITARTRPANGGNSRTYLLTGLLRCATCGRSMESQSSHGNAAYRCRHGHTSAHTAGMRRAGNLYLREDIIVGRVLAQLRSLTSRDAGIKEQIARIHQNRSTIHLAAFLRAHNIVIECRAMSISLEPDPEMTIIVRTLNNASKPDARMPRQRRQR